MESRDEDVLTYWNVGVRWRKELVTALHASLESKVAIRGKATGEPQGSGVPLECVKLAVQMEKSYRQLDMHTQRSGQKMSM